MSIVDTFIHMPIEYLLVCTFIFSLLIGSFINVIVYRFPIMMDKTWRTDCTTYLQDNGFKVLETEHCQKLPDKFNLAYPASSCPNCNHKIRWWENIPLISYIFLLKGKCSQCHTHISLRYPAIELLTAFTATYCVYYFGFSVFSCSLILFSYLLIALSWIDIDHQLIPDEFSYIILWLGLTISALASSSPTISGPIELQSAVFGALVGYLSLWTVYWLFKIFTGKEGMGYGDFKLFAAIGAWVGIEQLLLVILLASVTGTVFGIFALLIQKKNKIPFGPYLAVSGWLTLFFGTKITNWYLSYYLI